MGITNGNMNKYYQATMVMKCKSGISDFSHYIYSGSSFHFLA